MRGKAIVGHVPYYVRQKDYGLTEQQHNTSIHTVLPGRLGFVVSEDVSISTAVLISCTPVLIKIS